MRQLGILALLLALVTLSRRAEAFPYGTQFDADPLTGVGGGGRVFVGAARDTGHTCAVCHIGSPGRVGVHLEADPVDLFAGYRPGARYLLKVVLQNEWSGLTWIPNGNDCGDPDVQPWRPCDDNGFALEIDDGAGAPTGVLGSDGCGAPSAADADVRVLGDGTAITHAGNLHARVSWSFCWTAPADARGDLLLQLGVVDGSGGDGTFDNPNDPFGDDVFAAKLRIPEQGASSASGCAIGGGQGQGTGAATLVAVLALVVRALRPGWLPKTLLVFVLILAGCGATKGARLAGVRPWQKEKLAKHIMLVHPDAEEERLDLHMLESREGSQGGLGTSGGGCGCN